MCFEKMRTNFVSLFDVWSNCSDAIASISSRCASNSSPQIPRRAPPTISQVTKRGIADLALHNLFAIVHRELEHHQIGIIPNDLTSRQRHEPGSFSLAR